MPSRRSGGCDFLEDPSRDARDADPVWLADPDPLTAVGPAADDEAAAFSLWAIPGRKSLVHDGKRLLLRTTLGRRVVRLALDLNLTEGRAFAYAVPAGRRLATKRKAVALIDAALTGEAEALSGESVTRTDLVHMRAIQALDAQAYGASERDLALLLFPGRDTESFNDSALRAQVRYLLRHGRAFRDGRYRELLRADVSKPAESL